VRTSLLKVMQRGTSTTATICQRRVPSRAGLPIPALTRIRAKSCTAPQVRNTRNCRHAAGFLFPRGLQLSCHLPRPISLPRVFFISPLVAPGLDADAEICKLRFRPWRRHPIRSTILCRTSSSRSVKPRFFTAYFCADIRPTNFAATFAFPRPSSQSGIAKPSANLSSARFSNASFNTASTFSPFSKI
jgi:hypothetical protein